MLKNLLNKYWVGQRVQSFAVLFAIQLLSHARLFETPWNVATCPLLSPTACSNSCSLSQWYYNHLVLCRHPLLLPSTFSLGSFPVSQLFTAGGQSNGASASTSILPMNIQDWFPLGLTGLISLQSKGLSRVFSNTTVQKHQFFDTQSSLWSNSYVHTWLRENP